MKYFILLSAQMPQIEIPSKLGFLPYIIGTISLFATILLRKKLKKALQDIQELGFFGKIYLWIIIIAALLAIYCFTLKTVLGIILGSLLGLIALAFLFLGVLIQVGPKE